ncbi:PHD finger protein 21B isoform X3 [Clupea harengus]|uniref:PHD finger protein 21B isoform X3 n=1 Tax=Clupea harengus TaxID=7950 RepID=A0A6P8GVN0_CLUHA|nr:PHD finger protein 21B isoform X3 [Clupea harengus]
MELQGLQEALKVEIQCHQDGELKKQLHDRQTRITALSEKQKLAVRSCPVGPAKPLSLIKPSSQSIAISVVPAKAPVSMVTAHINGQKAASSEPLQTSPINLQTASRVMASSVHPYSRRVGELPHSQMLGTLTAVPIKVPQVSSLHRLAGQAPTVLPQVRPKTLIPDSLPVSPCQEQQSSQPMPMPVPVQPLSLTRSTVVLSPRSQGPPALPTANSTFSPERRQPHGQQGDRSPLPQTPVTPAVPTLPAAAISTAAASASPGVAYAIISTPTAVGNGVAAVSEAVKVQPLLFSADNKVIIIQPQVPSGSQDSPAPQTDSQSQESSSAPASPAKQKEEVDPEKIAFMVSLGLVTTEHLEEIQTKRQERKRRSTANPAYSGLFEPERKRLTSHYLSNPLFLSARDPEDLCWKDELEHDDHCNVCKEEGELHECHTCPRAYHLDCLHPPLKAPPKGVWMCPKCQKKVLNKENMAWPHNFVQSYVTHKTMKEEEKRKLLRRSCELKKECVHLQDQDQRLSSSLTKCIDLKDRLLGQQRETQASLERLKALIRLIQRDQVIQVTMTATTTTTAGASLLSLPWIKPTSSSGASSPSAATAPPMGSSALLQKSLPQPQGNN